MHLTIIRAVPVAPVRLTLLTALLAVCAIVATAIPQPALAQVSMSPPTVQPKRNGLVNETSIPLRVSWPAAPAAGSKVSRYTLQRSTNQGPWADAKLPTALSRAVVLRIRPWDQNRFRVRATYADGQVSGWGTSGPYAAARSSSSA